MSVRPPAYWRSRPFIYRLEGSRCTVCGHFHPYKRLVCRRCRSKRLDEDRLPSKGRLLYYTVVTQAQHGFENNTPYIVGLVEIDDGTQLVGQLTDCDPEDLKPGTVVEPVVRRIRADGDSRLIVYGAKFKPLV
ncbi:MAG: Zn-ribbon domain-containing OB-fold protein [Candidatus Caldarchaeum sp.]